MRHLLLIHLGGWFEQQAVVLAAVLRNLGYRVTLRTADEVQAAGGKTFVNTFDGAIWYEYRRATETTTGGDVVYSYVAYSAGDKPIFYLGGQRRGSVPADFALLAFNQGDPSTFYRWENDLYAVDSRRVGNAALNIHTGQSLWGRFYNYLYPDTPTDFATFRLNTALLGAQQQILWQLDWRRMQLGSAPPENHALAFRYYNRYFLPAAGNYVYMGYSPRVDVMARRAWGLPLLYWALQAEGLTAWQLPVCCENDHGVESPSAHCPVPVEDALRNQVVSTDWLLSYLRQHSIGHLVGVNTAHMSASHPGGWLQLKAAGNANQLRAMELWVAAERAGDAVYACWHDHFFDLGNSGTYTRHSGGQWGVPNNVNDPDAPFGTGQNATVHLRSRVPLQIHVEGNEMEMTAHGFRSAWGGANRALNCASNCTGPAAIIDWLGRLYGVRGIRSVFLPGMHTTGQGTSYSNPMWGAWAPLTTIGGVEVYHSDDLHLQATRGLYNPGSGSGADADLNQAYTLEATSADQAYRRYMGFIGSVCFGLWAVALGVPYWHPFACMYADPARPLADYPTQFNGYYEIGKMVADFVRALPAMLKGSTHTELFEHRRRVRLLYG